MTEQEYRTALQLVIKGTEKLDFPMLASFEKRQKILAENRMNIDLLIDSIQSNRGISCDNIASMRPALWEEADSAARAEFGNLSEKKMHLLLHSRASEKTRANTRIRHNCLPLHLLPSLPMTHPVYSMRP